jgi:hypothetical protein
MRLHDVLDDRQAEPRAALLPRARLVDTVEALEDPRQRFRRDPGPSSCTPISTQPASTRRPRTVTLPRRART